MPEVRINQFTARLFRFPPAEYRTGMGVRKGQHIMPWLDPACHDGIAQKSLLLGRAPPAKIERNQGQGIASGLLLNDQGGDGQRTVQGSGNVSFCRPPIARVNSRRRGDVPPGHTELASKGGMEKWSGFHFLPPLKFGTVTGVLPLAMDSTLSGVMLDQVTAS